jgi:hypothetical protein
VTRRSVISGSIVPRMVSFVFIAAGLLSG